MLGWWEGMEKNEMIFQYLTYPPRKLTWNLKMMVSSRNLLFQGFIFRFHVSFPGCNYQDMNHAQSLLLSWGTCFILYSLRVHLAGFQLKPPGGSISAIVVGCPQFWYGHPHFWQTAVWLGG